MKLTLPQQDIYFEQLLFPQDPIYNIGAKIEIKGKLDFEVLNQAYKALINQHDAYRITIGNGGENPSLEWQQEFDDQLDFIDFSDNSKAEAEANDYMQQEFLKPFDLFNGKLLHRFALVKVAEDFHYLFSVFHHIITDGWGTALMFQRFVQNYNELASFGEIRTKYPFSYKKFIEDDKAYQNSENYQEDKKYWLDKFDSIPENLFEKPATNLQQNKGNRKYFYIKREQYDQLNLLAKELKVSSFHIMLGLLYTYFGRVQGNTDFGIGIPTLNRNSATQKMTVGLFMGITTLRMQIDQEGSFTDFIKKIRLTLKEDYRHQRFPIGKLIQELGLFNESEKLFNLTLSYMRQDYSINYDKTVTRVIPMSHQAERVALAVYIREFDNTEDVKIDFDYNLGYFDEESIEQVATHFQFLLQEILKAPETKIKKLKFQPAAELDRLLKQFNDTEVAYAKEQTFIDLFDAQAKQNPTAIAVKDQSQSYSYQALAKLSDQIAAHFVQQYGNTKSPVAVLVDRSANMLALLLGIMKAGRSYVPLDPSFPKDRLAYILEHSQAKLMVSENTYQIDQAEEVEDLDLDTIISKAEKMIQLPFNDRPTAADTAYIIYTSGSTGKPKGVEIGHQSLLNFLTSIKEKPGIAAADKLFSVTTYSFDISILEFFLPLIAGASLYIAAKEILEEPALTIAKIAAEKPTLLQATPSFYQLLFNAGWQGDKQLKILCGGDALSESLAEKLLDGSKELWNMYGPTETTIWSSIKKIEKASDASNIGQAIQNTQLYILDEHQNPLPVGAKGALFIGGDGLAKGYYQNAALTQEKFVPNPFVPGRLMYETGDMGKWNAQGEIEFLGRNDNQVKIRGYRIELGEIETKLNLLPGIGESVVIAKKHQDHDAFLVAYLRCTATIEEATIIDSLKEELPAYMIPYTLIQVENFPLTPNKKVDRKTLSQRKIQKNQNQTSRLPKSLIEKELLAIWTAVLADEFEIEVTDNFFSLGGHSLNAVRLAAKINEKYNCNFGLKSIFEYPTIEVQARQLKTVSRQPKIVVPLASPKADYAVTSSQYLLWLAAQQEEKSVAYNMSAAYEIEGKVDLAKISQAFKSIIEKYEILRTNFVEVDGELRQKIQPCETLSFEIPQLLEGENLGQQIFETINQPFDLAKDSLLRINLIHQKDGSPILVFSTHHIIMDGWSLEIFLEEFVKNYNGYTTEALTLQFKDCVEWINDSKEEQSKAAVDFWKNYTANLRQKPSFATDFDQKGGNYAGIHHFDLEKTTSIRIKALCAKQGLTPHTFMAASLLLLIGQYSNEQDVNIAVTNTGRKHGLFNRQIGMFVNTLMLREQLDKEQKIEDFLKNVQANVLSINKYQDIPDKIRSDFNLDVLLTYQNPEFSFDKIRGITDFSLNPYPVNNQYSRMPIVFNIYEQNDNIMGALEYDSSLYSPDTIELITFLYKKLITDYVQNSQKRIGELELNLELSAPAGIEIDFDF